MANANQRKRKTILLICPSYLFADADPTTNSKTLNPEFFPEFLDQSDCF